MDGGITEYPAEIVSAGVVDEIGSGKVEAPASMLLTHIDTIRELREIGVTGDFSITFGDFSLTFPEE